MSHITYNEFKNRFGDLGITKYTKAMWLEEGCEEIGKVLINSMTIQKTTLDGIPCFVISLPNDGDRKGLYSQLYDISPSQSFTADMQINTVRGGEESMWFRNDSCTTLDEFKTAMKDKIILYKKAYVEFATPKVMEYESGFLLPNNTISPSVTWCHTDYINCEKYSKISLASTSTGIGDGAYDIFYDANKNVITAINHGEGFANEYQIPSNAVYMRLSMVINYEARHYSHKAYFK